MIKLTTKGVINVIIVSIVFILILLINDYKFSVNYKILLLPRKYVNFFDINSIITDTLIFNDLIYPYKV